MANYNDAHRLFLQIFISRKLMLTDDASKLYLKVGEQVEVDTPPDEFFSFVKTINKKLEPLLMELRQGRAEESGEMFYALVNCYEDEHSKLATNFLPQEIDYIKKVIELIVLSDEGVVSSIDLINAGHDLPKRITTHAAEEILNQLSSDRWLAEHHGKISLGARAVIELGQYLKMKFKDHINECTLCHDFVISGDMCINCGIKIHKYCAATNFTNIHASKRKCPSCKEVWENNLMKLPKSRDSGAAGQAATVREVEVVPAASSKTSKRARRSR